MPPGKKTKNTLACVFTVANVLGTWEMYRRPLLIYRLQMVLSGPGVDVCLRNPLDLVHKTRQAK